MTNTKQAKAESTHPYQDVIDGFLNSFNAMCKSEKKDRVIRENPDNGEGPSTSTYKVTFVADFYQSKSTSKWCVYGLNTFLFFFKKKFPLFDIALFQDTKGNHLYLKGLHTTDRRETINSKDDLRKHLQNYLIHCKSISVDAFTKI